jgi:hypothetical protein
MLFIREFILVHEGDRRQLFNRGFSERVQHPMDVETFILSVSWVLEKGKSGRHLDLTAATPRPGVAGLMFGEQYQSRKGYD